ncbi:MAG: hypothetical protein LH617_05885 [Ramlibacter sp.]|nr:hypothetical protein [Ramlibacter sp.]
MGSVPPTSLSLADIYRLQSALLTARQALTDTSQEEGGPPSVLDFGNEIAEIDAALKVLGVSSPRPATSNRPCHFT